MSTTPNTNKAPYTKWQSNDSNADWLQLSDMRGNISGWIDGSGVMSGSLNTGGGCSGLGCVQASTFGVTANGREVADATWSGGGSVITCPNNDCNFTTADSNKVCFAMPSAGMQSGPAAPGVLTYISAQSASCTASAVIGSAAGNGVFVWGTDDTAALVKAHNALVALPIGGELVLPAGRILISQGFGLPSSLPANWGATIRGQGYSVTSLVPLPGFNFSTCSANGCFWNPGGANGNSISYYDFSVNGELQSLAGISTVPANALFTIGNGGLAINVDFQNWATSAVNNPTGVQITGFAAYGIGLFTSQFGDGYLTCNSGYGIFQNCGGGTFRSRGNGACYDYSGTYNSLYIDQGSFYGFGTRTVAASGASSTAAMNVSTTAYLEKCLIGQGINAAGAVGLQFNSFNDGGGGTSTLYAKETTFNGGSTGGSIFSQVPGFTFVDQGGNTFTGGPVLFTGSYVAAPGNGSPVVGFCTGVATASSTLGLRIIGSGLSTAGAGIPMTCTSAAIDAGVPMQKSGTIFELLVNSSVAGVNASSGVVTVLKNGVAQTMTCTIGTGTSCTDGATAHQISYVKGDLISLQFTTQAADTLAGVKASLVVN